jgi:undecaprenyl-diphosphatase
MGNLKRERAKRAMNKAMPPYHGVEADRDPVTRPGAEPSPQAKASADAEKQELLKALREIKTPEQARNLVDKVISAASDTSEGEVREQEYEQEGTERTDRLQEMAAKMGHDRTASLLLEAAKEVAATSGETREALEEAFQEATNPEQHREKDPSLEKPLSLIRSEVLERMRPLQSIDARLFLYVNHLPHTGFTNRFMYVLTTIMNGGWGWVLGLMVAAMFDRQRGRQALHQVVPPLWLATMAVEYPIKSYFRRRRPFIDVVQAISVGRKPGTFSFPSGHSASSFAGAWLLRRHYPELTPLWYLLAATVAFSRIYVGVHYPGDVVSGAIAGTAIAEAARWVIEHDENSG